MTAFWTSGWAGQPIADPIVRLMVVQSHRAKHSPFIESHAEPCREPGCLDLLAVYFDTARQETDRQEARTGEVETSVGGVARLSEVIQMGRKMVRLDRCLAVLAQNLIEPVDQGFRTG